MHAILKLNCLDFIIVDIIAKLSDTSYFIFVITFQFLLFLLLSLRLLPTITAANAVVLLDLG